MIELVMKLLIKLREFQKIHNKIIEKRLLEIENDKEIPKERYIYLQKKDRKLLMTKD